MSTPDFWTPLTRETYDQWKTASPEDESPPEEDEETEE